METEEKQNEEVSEKPEKKKRKTAAERRQERQARREESLQGLDEIRAKFTEAVEWRKEKLEDLRRQMRDISIEIQTLQENFRKDSAKHHVEYHEASDE